MLTKAELLSISRKAQKERKRKTKEELIAEAKAIDAKKSKARKTPTKKEKADAEYEKLLNYKEEEKPVEQKKTISTYNDTGWDVKIGDPIEYFDPDLSYELTGYRPITKDRGLDFDPKVFTVAADTYRQNGKYTQYIPGTFIFKAFWDEEFRRCRDGVTIGKYTLTGENYFFLNYYRLLSVLGDGKGGEIREEDFPGFFTKLYEYFHYISLARKLGMDVCIFKSRGIGFSEISASNIACAYTFHRASYNIVTAFDEKYVSQTLSKVWLELDFLNTCTQGAFRHVRMKIDTAMKKKASKVDQDKNESGWGAIIEGIVHDSPRKLRGARVYNLLFEEAGSDKMLLETYIQSQPLVDILGFRIGLRTVGGTGGDAGPALNGLKEIFYNPKSYAVLPYKNFYGRNKDLQYTGFFIPSYTLWFGKYDSRGVVDEDAAKAYYENQRSKIANDHHLIRVKAEYCFTPEDAFTLEGSNVFDSVKLAELQVTIELKIIEPPRPAKLIWPYNKELQGVDRNAVPSVEFGTGGKILISELPIKNENGDIPDNLYVIGYDGVDLERATSTGQTDLSKCAIIVYRRMFGLKPPKIVAIYKLRPEYVDEAYDTALKLAEFYNAKILFEATRVGIFKHFQKLNKLGYFLKRPKATLSSLKQNVNQYGCPAPILVILHYIELILLYVSDYYDLIDFLEIIDELTRYSFENKTKFDLVVAFGMALLADEELLGKNPKLVAKVQRLADFGYYKNEYGLKVFGRIQEVTQSSSHYGWFRETGQIAY